MLIPTILAALGASVLSDKKEESRTYSIFEWNDGINIRRHVFFHNTYFCGSQSFGIQKATTFNTSGNTAISEHYTLFLSYKMTDDSDLHVIGPRLAWLWLKYFGFEYIDPLTGDSLDLPATIPELHAIAETGAPDRVDPYEFAIYQTGQMEKSLLLMSQEDFLKTIGRE